MSIRKTIEGETVEFKVTDAGVFMADLGDHGEVTARTLDDAVLEVSKVLKAARKVAPLDVTILGITRKGKADFYSSSSFKDGTEALDFVLRGYTPRTRTLLVTTIGTVKEKEKLDYHPFGDRVVRRLTKAEHAEYLALQVALSDAQRALEAFKAPRVIAWRERFEIGGRK